MVPSAMREFKTAATSINRSLSPFVPFRASRSAHGAVPVAAAAAGGGGGGRGEVVRSHSTGTGGYFHVQFHRVFISISLKVRSGLGIFFLFFFFRDGDAFKSRAVVYTRQSLSLHSSFQ